MLILVLFWALAHKAFSLKSTLKGCLVAPSEVQCQLRTSFPSSSAQCSSLVSTQVVPVQWPGRALWTGTCQSYNRNLCNAHSASFTLVFWTLFWSKACLVAQNWPAQKNHLLRALCYFGGEETMKPRLRSG